MSADLEFAEVIPPSGWMTGLLTEAERAEWETSVSSALDAFRYEYCECCGRDADRHRVSPDMFGHPHIWCLDASPED